MKRPQGGREIHNRRVLAKWGKNGGVRAREDLKINLQTPFGLSHSVNWCWVCEMRSQGQFKNSQTPSYFRIVCEIENGA